MNSTLERDRSHRTCGVWCDETRACTSRRVLRARASFANALFLRLIMTNRRARRIRGERAHAPRRARDRLASSSARRRQMSPRVLDHGFRDVRVHVSIVAVALASALVASRGRGLMSTGRSRAGRRGWKPRPRPEPWWPGGRRQMRTRRSRRPRRSRRSWKMRDATGIPGRLILRHGVAVEPTRGLGRRGPVQQWIGKFHFRARGDRRHGGGGPVAPGLGIRRRAERPEACASRGGVLLHGLLHHVPWTARSGL